MAVTTEKSEQINNASAFPPVANPVHDVGGRVRFRYFKFTQGAAAGDANSLADLVTLPQGTLRVYPWLSRLKRTAFGAARTLDVGITAHKDIDMVSVAAVVDSILDGLDVSAAGAAAMGTGTNAQDSILVKNGDGKATVQAKVLGDTIPAGAVLEGVVAYTID
jgi:hypothetical protein